MKYTKESIARYCVDSKGDKNLAEQIARQFERAGFEKIYFFNTDMPEGNNFVYVYLSRKGNHTITACTEGSKERSNLTETTLTELTKMVDEYLGYQEALEGFVKEYKQVDEYEIVREFMDMMEEFRHYTPKRKENAIERFKTFRVCNPTLDELKAVYAESKGIEVSKIEVRVSENK